MKSLEQMNDWLEICELKARYYRLMDTKDWKAYRELFAEDYELDVAEAGGVELIRGRDNAIQMVLSHIEHATTVHQVYSPEIELDSDKAKGIWAMQDRALFPTGPKITGYGHYTDRYVRRNGEWLISASKLTRLHIDIDSSPKAGWGCCFLKPVKETTSNFCSYRQILWKTGRDALRICA